MIFDCFQKFSAVSYGRESNMPLKGQEFQPVLFHFAAVYINTLCTGLSVIYISVITQSSISTMKCYFNDRT
jgi:hypothetical protein